MALLCALSFAVQGCSSIRERFVPTPVVERVKVKVDPGAFDCGEEPLAPEDRPEVTELEVGRWVAELQAWGRGCQARLVEVEKVVNAP